MKSNYNLDNITTYISRTFKIYFFVFLLCLFVILFLELVSNKLILPDFSKSWFLLLTNINDVESFGKFHSLSELNQYIASILISFFIYSVWVIYTFWKEIHNGFLISNLNLKLLSICLITIIYGSYNIPFTENYTLLQPSYKVYNILNILKSFILVSGFFLFLPIIVSSILNYFRSLYPRK